MILQAAHLIFSLWQSSCLMITSVLGEKKNQIISSIFIILVLMMASSLCMYSAEHEVQPEVFDNAFSGMWWSISTILTVGYGDIYPVTAVGRGMAIIISFLGVGAVAIPTGIISAGFVEQYTRMQNRSHAKENGRGTISLVVDSASPFLEQPVKAIESSREIDIIAFVRNGAVVLPSDDNVVKEGDVLLFRANPSS